jgi:hypothetical protein
MPDEINSAFSQAIGQYRDLRREYVSLYKKATPADNAKLIERDREMTHLQTEASRGGRTARYRLESGCEEGTGRWLGKEPAPAM